MNRLFQTSLLLCFAVVFATSAALAQVEGVNRDNGTGPDGVMIFPAKLAMFCDISSFDIKKDDVVEKCLNKLILESKGSQTYKQSYSEIFNDSYRQMNNVYLTTALQKKAAAGNVDNQLDQIESESGQMGALSSESENIRRKQTINANIYGLTAESVADIMDVYSSRLALDAFKYYYAYEFSGNAAPVDEEDAE